MSCPLKSLLSKDKLKNLISTYPKETEAVEGWLTFRLVPQYAALMVTVNLLFFVIGYFNLSFFAVVALFAFLYNLLQLALMYVKAPLVSFLFPENFPKGGDNESNRVRPSSELVKMLDECKCCDKCPVSEGKKGLLVKLGVLAGSFVFFYLTGTFWLNFVVVNLALVLPGVLLHPQVNPHVVKVLDSLMKKKKD